MKHIRLFVVLSSGAVVIGVVSQSTQSVVFAGTVVVSATVVEGCACVVVFTVVVNNSLAITYRIT